MTTGLASSMEDTIKHRFRSIYDSKEAVLAAITLPKLKLQWVETQNQKDRYNKIVTAIDRYRINKTVTAIDLLMLDLRSFC